MLTDYPYAQLMRLLVQCHYTGWILLECRTNPADRVAALAEQKTSVRGTAGRRAQVERRRGEQMG